MRLLKMFDYFLNFSSHYDRDKGLDEGRLRLDSLSKGNIDVWIATSSTVNKQGRESYHQWGGLIPPGYRCDPPVQWTVSVAPIWMPEIKGVEGYFYKINPHNVKTDKGQKRGDFGIHLDANVPGSGGCIVMSGKRFESFKVYMKRVENRGILSLPLFITYS